MSEIQNTSEGQGPEEENPENSPVRDVANVTNTKKLPSVNQNRGGTAQNYGVKDQPASGSQQGDEGSESQNGMEDQPGQGTTGE